MIIEPKEGTLKALESKNLEFNFIPLKKKKYKISVPIKLSQVIGQAVIGYYHPGSANLDQEL